MGVTKIVAACICGLLSNISFVQEPGWRGIVPLHSTREDVERLVGPPMTPGGITYDLKTDRLNVVYSAGSCLDAGAQWNVPRGTVIGIIAYPQTRLILADLKIDLNRFEKFINSHVVGGRVSYSNKEEGIGIEATSNGEVISIQYFPRANDSDLRCPGTSSSLSNEELQYYKFDEYSNLSLTDEKARLDNFAVRLQKGAKSKAYILAYASRTTRSRQALERAKRAREYLMKKWRIDSRRIEVRFAGNRDKPTWQLCIVPEDFKLSDAL